MSLSPSPLTICAVLGFLMGTGCAARQNADQPGGTPPARSESSGSSVPLAVQLDTYLMAQEALAADHYGNAKTALESLKALASVTTGPLAHAAASADDIETMRARFKPLSEYFASLELPVGYARAYCPMYDQESAWVQRDGPVRNPYYGSEMLTCGVVDAAPGAHMDHSPQHGGIVFMAPDSFHHIEGAYPEEGVFRLYVTNNYREPVDVGHWSGRAVLEEKYDEATDEFIDVIVSDLVPSSDGMFLEAAVGGLVPPTEVTAKVIFATEVPEERFDFVFPSYSAETDLTRVSDPSGTMRGAPAGVPLAERIRPEIPDATAEVVAGIMARDKLLRRLIDSGAFTELFIPALQAKELALALVDRTPELAVRHRHDVQIAIRHLVRAAWLLDWYGDLGDQQQVNNAYDIFRVAVGEIVRVYGNKP